MRPLAIAAAWLLVAWGHGPPRGADPPAYPVDEAPARLAAGVAAADQAIAALQGRLSGRLQEELRQGGPLQAIDVCRVEAPSLTADVTRARSLRIGRTSQRLRNPGNAAPAWAEPLVNTSAGKPVATVGAVVVDLGSRVGVLRPIPTVAQCLQCHGPAESLAPAVRDFLAAAYPDDRAVGFEEGDLRGFFWAEAPLGPPADRQPSPGEATFDRAAGERLFAEAYPRCTACHSVAGAGNRLGPPLDGVGDRLGPDEIRAWIRVPAEMAKKGGSTRTPAMVPYPEFSDEELDALVAYLVALGPAPRPD